jgi:NADPH:quinone reductase-like Zn-dependent oxidoreductase
VLYNFGISGTPWILGRDIAGVVEKVGTDVTDLKPGERVWVCADSRDVRSGAYQAYSIARRAHLGSIDAEISNEEAATLGTGLVTAAIAAYWFFNWSRATCLGGRKAMPRSSQMDYEGGSETPSNDWVLIYGGGSITGVYLAQLAKLSGLRTISIASPCNFDYLASLGVTHCVDRYLEPEEVQERVLSIVGQEGVSYCMDAVGSKTATICRGILRSAGKKEGQMLCLAGDPKAKSVNENHDRPAKMRKGIAGGGRVAVDAQESLNRSVKVHKISFSTTFYGDDLFAKSVLHDLDALLKQKELLAARSHIWPDGLAGVRGGLESLRDNCAPHGKKLVVNLADTPHSHFTNLGVRSEVGWNGVV